MNENAVREVLECLRQLADPEFQARVWVRGEGPEVSSYVEVACQLFDDTGLGDLLEHGTADAVIGSEAVGELLRLWQLVDSIPSGVDAASLARLPAWKEIVRVAGRAHSLLAGSMGV
jgi:hypothetical protein